MNIIKEGGRLMNAETGEYYPWYTHPTLEWLDTLDLSQKRVYEYGIGDSSLWWAKRCFKLCAVESNLSWFEKVKNSIGDIALIECNQNYLKYNDKWEITNIDEQDLYINAINKYKNKFDIIIIDGIDREDCVKPSLNKLNNGGFIIYDNWMQPSVTVQSEKTQEILLAMNHKIYHQPGHPDWKTAVFFN